MAVIAAELKSQYIKRKDTNAKILIIVTILQIKIHTQGHNSSIVHLNHIDSHGNFTHSYRKRMKMKEKLIG